MELIFATHNQHKLEEVQQIVGSSVLLLSLKEIGCEEDIPETSTTLEGNALQKARYVYDKYGRSCFADDTGLEIEALDGKPGVYSARYAGEECSFEDNMKKVLSEMEGKQNRKACFRSVIALILDGKEYFFEGRVDGEILPDRHGKEGFGYDPIFKPLGYDKTFSQMSMDEKNKISHRGRAMEKLTKFLREII